MMSSLRVEAEELLAEYIEVHESGACSCEDDGTDTGYMCLGMRVIGGSVDEEDAIADLMETLA